MTSIILTTKLYKPSPRPNLVSRPRLLKRLDAAGSNQFTLISAPAGYGKSTLLTEYVSQTKVPAAWLSLDVDDNDPARFWVHFVGALRTLAIPVAAQVGENLLDQLLASPPAQRTVLLGGLIAEMAAIQDPFILILDDLHLVVEPQIQDELFYLLEALLVGISGLHLILSSRSDPPWPLARLRVRNQISEIRVKDLRFTPDEATLFLKCTMQLALTPTEYAQLNHRTEGWAAGLQMAALSLRGQDDSAEFLARFSGTHRYILDYLMEEVLSQQSPTILEFLLKTSILERLTGSLCAAVCENETSHETLQQLEKANMFLIAQDEQRIWYRYHQLFADLLRKQLQNRHPQIIPELHRRASQWYSQAGLPLEAVAHALKTGDHDLAAVRVEEHVLDLIQQGEITLARQWLRALPEEVIRPRPVLCIAQAWTSTNYANVEVANDLLLQAEAALAQEPEMEDCLDPQVFDLVSKQIAVLQVVIARVRGDATNRQQELALAALEQLDPTQDTASRATLLLRLGYCYLDLGQDEEAQRTFVQAFELGQPSGNLYAAHMASYGRMVITKRHGQMHACAAICRQTLKAIHDNGEKPASLAGIALCILGSLYYEWNDLEEAERLLAKGLNWVTGIGVTELLVKGAFALACLKIARGELESPPDIVGMARQGSPGLMKYAAALQARLNLILAQNEVDSTHEQEAFLWAEGQRLELGELSTYDWEIYEKLVYARVLCRQSRAGAGANWRARLAEILDFLQKELQTLEELDWGGLLIETKIVIAQILLTLQQKAEALSVLESALRQAEPQGYIRSFLDEGEPMRELFHLTRAKGISESYVGKFLLAFEAQPKPAISEAQRSANRIEPLSEREQQVLRLLDTRLTVPEIASEIHLAPSTVRTHIQNIYRKLDVHGRLEALEQAKEYGLL